MGIWDSILSDEMMKKSSRNRRKDGCRNQRSSKRAKSNCCSRDFQIFEVKLIANDRSCIEEGHRSKEALFVKSIDGNPEYTASVHDMRDGPSANPIRRLDLDLHFLQATAGSGTGQTALTADSV